MAIKGAENEAAETTDKGRDAFIWIRDDGAVCFGDECATLKPGPDKTLELAIKPDKCGSQVGEIILDHLIKTAGQGVTIKIMPVGDPPGIRRIDYAGEGSTVHVKAKGAKLE